MKSVEMLFGNAHMQDLNLCYLCLYLQLYILNTECKIYLESWIICLHAKYKSLIFISVYYLATLLHVHVCSATHYPQALVIYINTRYQSHVWIIG